MNAITPQPIDFDTRVGQYVKLRDKIKEIKDKHKAELKPYAEALEQLNGMLLQHLNSVGADSVKATSGTVYRTLDKKASVADKSAFWTWVVTQGKFEFIDYKANVTAVFDFIGEQVEAAKGDPSIQPAPPPGVNVSSSYEVGVRRGK